MKITEALAEFKTISKRMDKKQEFVQEHIARSEALKDPLAKDGGAAVVLQRELQAIADLSERIIKIRVAIQQINQTTAITIAGHTRTIAEWLTWRKEVAPKTVEFTDRLASRLSQIRSQATKMGGTIFAGAAAVASSGDTKPQDIIINLSESELAKQREQLQLILGELDGQLSLKNATIDVTLDVAPLPVPPAPPISA